MRFFAIAGLLACSARRPTSTAGAPAHPVSRPQVIAHRGGAGQWPEQTLFAFHNARAEGPSILDADVRRSADGVLVLLHDDTVDRTTNGSGPAGEMALAQLRLLDAGHCFSPQFDPQTDFTEQCRNPPAGTVFPYRGMSPRLTIATLEELFAAVPRTQAINLEIKRAHSGIEREVAALVRRFDRVGSTCVGAFDDDTARALRTELHDGCVWAPQSVYECQFAAIARGTGWSQCESFPVLQPGVREFELSAEYVRRAHAEGRVVQVWTLNDETSMRRAIGLGVDGIFTDYPARLRAGLTPAEAR